MAVVTESPDDLSVVFRTYCSQWPVDGRRHVRPPILRSRPFVPAMSSAVTRRRSRPVTPTAVGRHVRAGRLLPRAHRPAHAPRRRELRSFFAERFSAGGGIGLQDCAVTDDGVRCAVEYNCVRWGSHQVPPQAGLGVYERGTDGLLAPSSLRRRAQLVLQSE